MGPARLCIPVQCFHDVVFHNTLDETQGKSTMLEDTGTSDETS